MTRTEALLKAADEYREAEAVVQAALNDGLDTQGVVGQAAWRRFNEAVRPANAAIKRMLAAAMLADDAQTAPETREGT